MAKFVVNSQRYDPYKNFKFRVKIDGKPVGAVTGLTFLTGSGTKKSKKKMPGLRKFGNLTMKRGVFKETKFYKWMAVLPGSKKFPLDIVIEQVDEKGKSVATYHLTNAWLFRIEGPSLKAGGNEVFIESIELSHEGLEIIKC